MISSWTFSKSSDFLSLCATLQALVMSVKVKNTKVSTDGLQRKKPKKKQKLFHKAQASHSVGCGATWRDGISWNFLKPLGNRGKVEKETCNMYQHVMMPLGKYLGFLQRTMALCGVHVWYSPHLVRINMVGKSFTNGGNVPLPNGLNGV